MLSVTNKPYMLSVVAPFSPSFPKIVFSLLLKSLMDHRVSLKDCFSLITFSSFTLMTRRRNDVTKPFFRQFRPDVNPRSYDRESKVLLLRCCYFLLQHLHKKLVSLTKPNINTQV